MTDSRGSKKSSVLGWMISIWKSLKTITKCYKPPANSLPKQTQINIFPLEYLTVGKCDEQTI